MNKEMIWNDSNELVFADEPNVGVAGIGNNIPDEVGDNYIRFMVNIDGFSDPLVFLKSKRTERWWMVVQSPNNMGERYRRHQFVPCSYADYQSAMNQEIPDRWWKVQQKLM